MSFYLVSQNKSYAEERRLGILFAPTTTNSGKPAVPHWRTMDDLDPADVILCGYRQHIVSIAIPRGPSIIAARPPELPEDWANEGWVCEVEYHDLPHPVHVYEEVELAWRIGESRFDRHGQMTQQYLVQLSSAFAGYFTARFGARLPASTVDPAAAFNRVQPDGGTPKFVPMTTVIEQAGKSTTTRKPVTDTLQISLAHGALVLDYASHIETKYGYRPVARAYPTPVSSQPLRADAVDDRRGLLLEAKPELDVNELYRAIGQLTIYRQLESTKALRGAVLTGPKPQAWYLERLTMAGISCVWRTAHGFEDNAEQAFV